MIHKNNGNTDTVEIIEINPQKIVYKKGIQKLSISKTAVKYIEFADGTIEIMPRLQQAENKQPLQLPLQHGPPNSISINWMGFMLGDINAGYERYLQKDNFSFRLNVNYHLFDFRQDVFNMDRIYAARLDFNFFTSKSKTVRYFVGPSLRAAKLVNFSTRHLGGRVLTDKKAYSSFALLFINGFQIETNSSLFISAMVGFGIGSGKQLGTENNYADTEGVVALNMGYRFR